jgi:DNA sulfur modification protein DndE
MQINLKTSEENHKVVSELTRKLPNGTKENVIARLAIGYSLSLGNKFQLKEMKDQKGKEYKDHVLFDEKYKDFYVALICQHYDLYKTDEDIPKYFKIHLDHGLQVLNKMFETSKNYTIYDFLLENIDKGVESLEDFEITLDAVKNNNQNITKDYFTAAIKIEIGSMIEDKDKKIYLNVNNTKQYNNFHIAVAGNSGTGKTQFALELLNQYSKESNGQVNFIYLDFKGLKKGEENGPQYKPFFEKTKTIYIDAPQKPFPLNPLTFIDNINEMNKKMGISKFVDIIAKYSNIGKRQEQTLKDATREAFEEKKGGEFPSLKDIYDKVVEAQGDRRDTLTEILDSLTDYTLFESKPKVNFLSNNYYLSLSGDLPNAVRFTSIFLIINYIYNTFMNMDNTPNENGIQGMRYVLLIDEAHVIFKEKKSQDLLEKILREIRSKGVTVALLSQGIEEFNQPTFDFSSMCEIAFLLDIKAKSNSRMINKFLGFSDKESAKVARSMEKIQKGQAISNIKEFNKGELFNLKQFRDK